MMKRTMVLAMACLMSFSAAGQVLFEQGRTSWKIVLPLSAGEVEQYAAEELQGTLKKISGADFPVVRQQVPVGKNLIAIGTAAAFRQGVFLEPDLSGDSQEELLVKTWEGGLWLLGNNPRGALYAVYAFLRNQLGARWFWPGDGGEFLTSMDRYELPSLNYREKPSFRYRELTPCGRHNHIPTEIWLARNLVNGGSRTLAIRDKAGFHSMDCGHWTSVPSRLFAAHPEYFAFFDGRRMQSNDGAGCSPCWSSEGAFREMVAGNLRVIRQKKLKILNTFPSDVTIRCECPQCAAKKDVSARWYEFYARMIDEIRKEIPDMKFAGLAYQEYRKVPGCPIRNLEFVEYAQYNRCYVHRLEDPSCRMNRDSMAELKRWTEKTQMGIYGYEFDVLKGPYYLPLWNVLAEEMKVFRKLKLNRMKTELHVDVKKNTPRIRQYQMSGHRLVNYLYARLMWNAEAEVDDLLKDWCEKVYGPGAEPLFAYHRRMAEQWDNMKIHLTYIGNSAESAAKFLLDKAVVGFAEKQFREAELAVRKKMGENGGQRFLQEIRLEKQMFEAWKQARQRALDNRMMVNLPLLKGENEFHRLGSFRMKAGKAIEAVKAEPLPAEIRLYHTGEALMIQATCREPDMQGLRRGAVGRDVSLWKDDGIEIFLDLQDGSPYRHFAVNPAGGTYDARGTDKSWNPAWSAVPRLERDRWIMTVKLPFASLGKMPEPPDCWKLIVIRNSRPIASGFPVVAYHDTAQGAEIFFTRNGNPNLRLAWLSSPHKAFADRYMKHSGALNRRGWQMKHSASPEQAEKLDLSDSRIILIETCGNALSNDFYQKQLVPAVKDGAVAVFHSYFGLGRLHRNLGDESFQIKCVENAARTRKPSWLKGGSFSTTPHQLRTVMNHTPSCNFIPLHPDQWDVLMKQKTRDGKELPFMLARPFGKGTIVVTGDLLERIVPVLENLLEYARKK